MLTILHICCLNLLRYSASSFSFASSTISPSSVFSDSFPFSSSISSPSGFLLNNTMSLISLFCSLSSFSFASAAFFFSSFSLSLCFSSTYTKVSLIFFNNSPQRMREVSCSSLCQDSSCWPIRLTH